MFCFVFEVYFKASAASAQEVAVDMHRLATSQPSFLLNIVCKYFQTSQIFYNFSDIFTFIWNISLLHKTYDNTRWHSGLNTGPQICWSGSLCCRVWPSWLQTDFLCIFVLLILRYYTTPLPTALHWTPQLGIFACSLSRYLLIYNRYPLYLYFLYTLRRETRGYNVLYKSQVNALCYVLMHILLNP